MPYAVEFYFDSESEGQFRRIVEHIEAAVMPMAVHGHRPHLSLVVSDGVQVEAFRPALQQFAAQVAPFVIGFPGLGIFPTSEGVLYATVTFTQHLRDLHARFHTLFTPFAVGLHDYYRVDRWTPHCTVGFGLGTEQLARAVEVALREPLPATAQAHSIGLVNIEGSQAREMFEFGLAG